MIYKYLYYDVYNRELTIIKSQKEYCQNSYYAGYLPIYTHSISGLEVTYTLPNTKAQFRMNYTELEIENFGYSIVQEHYFKQHNLELKHTSIDKIRVSEEFYDKLCKIAEKNEKLPVDKRIKCSLNDILNLKVGDE